ncbi:hypothetical protein GCM10010532_039720 [Dactylosporangium siamense]
MTVSAGARPGPRKPHARGFEVGHVTLRGRRANQGEPDGANRRMHHDSGDKSIDSHR